MQDKVATGIIEMRADVDEAIRNIRQVDREYQSAMRSIDRQRATLRVTTDVQELKEELHDLRGLTDKQSKADRARIKDQLQGLALEKSRIGLQNQAASIEEKFAKAVFSNNERQRRQEELLAKERQREVERRSKAMASLERQRQRSTLNEASDVAKLQQAYVKAAEAKKKAEQQGTGIRGRLPAVSQQVRLDTRAAEARMTMLRGQLAALGAEPVEIDVRVEGGGPLARLLKTMSDMSVRVGPLTMSLKSFGVSLAVLGPLITSLLGSLTALVGVLGTGLVGATALATAGLGGFALAAGGIFAIVKPMVGELGKVRKAQEAVVTAGEKYGRWSKEASKAQEKLNNLLKGIPKDTEGAIASIGTLGERWENLTKSSRPTFFRMIASGVTAINELMPTFAANANVAFSQVTRGFEGWMQGLTSGNSRRDLANIFSGFNAAIPPLMRGLGHIGTALRNIAAETAPYLRPLAGVFNSWAKGIADSTGNTPALESSLFTLVEHAKSLGRFLNTTGDLIRTVLSGGAESGKEMLDTLTALFREWDDFLNEAEGQTAMKDFFEGAQKATGIFFSMLSNVTGAFFKLSQILLPISDGFFTALGAGAKLLNTLLGFEAAEPILQAIGAAMAAVFVVNRIMGVVGAVKTAAGAFGALFKVVKAHPFVAIIAILVALGTWLVRTYQTNDKFRERVDKAWDRIQSAGRTVGEFFRNLFTNTIPQAINNGVNLIASGVNRIIDVINLIPGVKIPKVTGVATGGGGSGRRPVNRGNAQVGNGGRRMPARARGGLVDAPMVLVGEEAPRHPEYVVPTNPAYRGRALDLYEDLGRQLGVGPDPMRIAQYKKGGKIDPHQGHNHGGTPGRKPGTGGFVEDIAKLPMKALTGGAKWFLNKLPKFNLPPWMDGAGKFALAKAAAYIKEKAGNLLGNVGMGGGTGSLAIATRLAAKFGNHISSGYRPGDPGYHGVNRARDYAGGDMLGFARAAVGAFGKKALEIIHTPLGFGVKNGQRVAPYAAADHYDHVHIAMAQGGKISRNMMSTLKSAGSPGLKRGGVAQRAYAEARRLGAPRKLIKALLEAGIVESGMQHDKYLRVGSGDRDSVGFLQQRPSQGWGRSKSMAKGGVELDTRDFISRGKAIIKAGFKGGAGKLAQAIQRSAYPGRYAQQSGRADAMLKRFGAGNFRTGKGGAPAPREIPVRGRTTDLANRIAQQQGVLDFASRTEKARDDVRAILGYDQTVKLSRGEKRGLRRRLRRLPLHRSSAPEAARIQQQLKTGTRTVHRAGMLDLKLQERDVQRARLQKIDKALRGKLRPSTRTRLLEEKASLQTSLAQGRAERAELRQRARQAPENARRARFDERTSGLETSLAEATLTSGLGDDLTAVNNLQTHWQKALVGARKRGDNEGIRTAISSISQLANQAEDLQRRIELEPLETAASLASLKAGLGDDLEATQNLLNYWQGVLDNATDDATRRTAAGNVSQFRSEAAALAERIATDPIEAQRALARLTEGSEDDLIATQKLLDYWQPILDAAIAANDFTAIQRIAPIVGGLRDEIGSAPTMAEQIGAFNAARLDLYKNMGSNFSPVAAAAPAGNSTTIINNFDAPPTDPHTWVKQQMFELQAAL